LGSLEFPVWARRGTGFFIYQGLKVDLQEFFSPKKCAT